MHVLIIAQCNCYTMVSSEGLFSVLGQVKGSSVHDLF